MNHPESIVIVGSGAAGAKGAEAVRNEGYAGRLTMASADPTPPYARPPLSKVYLRGELELEKFLLAQPDDVDRRLATRVADVDAGAREVVLEDGERVGYDRLLLATGAEPRRLQIPGAELDGILYLRELECDFVVAGIGVSPRVELAERAGAELANGVVTDEFLETRVPGVFAAGDIAFAHHPFYDDNLRVEHWMTGARMGPVAAANMLGERRPFDALPYFYSDQFDSKMEYWGFAPKWDEVVLRGD